MLLSIINVTYFEFYFLKDQNFKAQKIDRVRERYSVWEIRKQPSHEEADRTQFKNIKLHCLG